MARIGQALRPDPTLQVGLRLGRTAAAVFGEDRGDVTTQAAVHVVCGAGTPDWHGGALADAGGDADSGDDDAQDVAGEAAAFLEAFGAGGVGDDFGG